jgi:hypothetical protein
MASYTDIVLVTYFTIAPHHFDVLNLNPSSLSVADARDTISPGRIR